MFTLRKEQQLYRS